MENHFNNFPGNHIDSNDQNIKGEAVDSHDHLGLQKWKAIIIVRAHLYKLTNDFIPAL